MSDPTDIQPIKTKVDRPAKQCPECPGKMYDIYQGQIIEDDAHFWSVNLPTGKRDMDFYVCEACGLAQLYEVKA